MPLCQPFPNFVIVHFVLPSPAWCSVVTTTSAEEAETEAGQKNIGIMAHPHKN
jgi:hypothetical protein